MRAIRLAVAELRGLLAERFAYVMAVRPTSGGSGGN